MVLTRLTVENFTVFGPGRTTFDLSSGVNVLVGENGTGKTHLLKLVYVLSRVSEEHGRRQVAAAPRPHTNLARPESSDPDQGATQNEGIDRWIATDLNEVFLPDSLGSFAHRSGEPCVISAEWGRDVAVWINIGKDGRIGATLRGQHRGAQPSLFLPSRELLTIYPGFAAAWLRRESSFDRTYLDLCLALGLRPLRPEARAGAIEDLATVLEGTLKGPVTMEGDRFYQQQPRGPMEVTMVGEGDRKIAMLAYLLRNGSLAPGGLLAWDEPEASLNPKRANLMSKVAFDLARAGIQVVLSTHDYALCSELDLAAKRGSEEKLAFFGLKEGDRHVEVERSPSFLGLKGNPILEAFADIYDREEAWHRGEGAP
ncbi:MAG: AAA family ATPase [Myxococcales bacterium]|nr:AAA family ATPase [Myxococcales bacterium]